MEQKVSKKKKIHRAASLHTSTSIWSTYSLHGVARYWLVWLMYVKYLLEDAATAELHAEVVAVLLIQLVSRLPKLCCKKNKSVCVSVA